MQKVIIDTNVLVSALIQRSYPYLIINEHFIDGKIELCISDGILEEYNEVLKRDKFAKYVNFISNSEILLANIEARAIKYNPKLKIDIISDPNDNKFIELAAESKAHFLITGNTNDFTMATYKKTKIVTPKQYWEDYQ